MQEDGMYSVNWFNETVQRINQLENELKTNLSNFNDSLLMEEQEVLDLLKISTRTLSRYCKKKYFTRYKIGNRNVYFLHDILRGILQHLAH